RPRARTRCSSSLLTRSDRRSSTSSEKPLQRPWCAIATRSSLRKAGRHTWSRARPKYGAGSMRHWWGSKAGSMKSAIPRFARGPERAPPRATDLFTASRTPRSTSVTLSSRAICMWGGAQRDESQGHGRRYEGEAVDAQGSADEQKPRGRGHRRSVGEQSDASALGSGGPLPAAFAAAPASLALSCPALGDGCRPFLPWHLVASVAPDAFGVRGNRGERDAELRCGELLARPVDHPNDDRFLPNVHSLRRCASRRSAGPTHARGDMERVAELGQLALHLLIGLELVDEAALEPAADAGELRLVQRQVLLFGHAYRDVRELVEPRRAAQLATAGAHAGHHLRLVAGAHPPELDARAEVRGESRVQLAE